MRWDLEERTEDAIVSYLMAKVSGDMRVYAAYSVDEIQYPCAVVFAEATAPVSEDAEWDDNRAMLVRVAVKTEAAPTTNGVGITIRTARERNADARSDVLNALAVPDLAQQIVDVGVESIAFSHAQLTTSERSTDGQVLVTTLTLDVISEPVEDS